MVCDWRLIGCRWSRAAFASVRKHPKRRAASALHLCHLPLPFTSAHHQVHVAHAAFPSAVFRGENAIHCLAANSRANLLADLLRFAAANLNFAQNARLLNTFGDGPFFRDKPMRFYGGSPLAYLSVFKCAAASDSFRLLPMALPAASDGLQCLMFRWAGAAPPSKSSSPLRLSMKLSTSRCGPTACSVSERTL